MCALQGLAGLGTKSDNVMALKPQVHREAVLTPQQEIDILGSPAVSYQPSAQDHLKRFKDSDPNPMWPRRGRKEHGTNLRWAQPSQPAHSPHPTPAENGAAGGREK